MRCGSIDILVQDRWNATAAKRFFKRLLTDLRYKPRGLATDGLKNYGVARREVLLEVRHRTSRYLTDVFDKLFFEGRCYSPLARAAA